LKDWKDAIVATLLRVGVLLSIGIIAVGMVITFIHHPDYFSSRPALGTLTAPDAHFPRTIGEVIAGVRRGSGQAVVTAGLLVLIAIPVARVALSIVLFIIERDRLYTAITATVLVVLLISFVVGRAGG